MTTSAVLDTSTRSQPHSRPPRAHHNADHTKVGPVREREKAARVTLVKRGPISNLRAYLDACSWLLALALSACGGDDAPPGGADAGATPTAGATSARRTGPAAEATELCLDACDHEIEVGCSGTPATYLPFCVRICERT